MYLLYLDDSGSAGNRTEQHLVLGGVSIFERQVHWISEEMNRLAEQISPISPEQTEFHAYDIFSGKEAPWKGMPRQERINTIKETLNILANSNITTQAFACIVDKESFPKHDPMELAFENICNRFDLLLKAQHHQGNTQRGIIILDRSSYETSLQYLARDFRTLGTKWGITVNINEVPLFVDSKLSRLIQLADHVAYSVYRRYERGDTQYLDIILNRFGLEDGKLHNLVHKTHKSSCMCPACLSRK